MSKAPWSGGVAKTTGKHMTATSPANGKSKPLTAYLPAEVMKGAVAKLAAEGHSSEQIIMGFRDFRPDIAKKYGDELDQLVEIGVKEYEKALQKKIVALTIDELINQPLPKWMIEGIFPEGAGVGIIAGASGDMKTFLALYLCMMIATGTKLDKLKVAQAGVVYMANEGQAGLGQRIRAQLNFMGISAPDNFRVIQSTPYLMEPDTLEEYIETLKALSFGVGMLVIDTMSKASLGGTETDNSDMAEAMETAKELADRLGCIVLLIDHVGKDRKKGIRGASSKYANADMVGMVSKADDNVMLKTTKQKDFEDGLEFNFKVNLVDVTDPHTDEVRQVPALSYRHECEPLTHKEFILNSLEQQGRVERDTLLSSFTDMYGDDKKEVFKTTLSRLRNGKKPQIEEVDGYVQSLN
jgi:hypothetical protein